MKKLNALWLAVSLLVCAACSAQPSTPDLTTEAPTSEQTTEAMVSAQWMHGYSYAETVQDPEMGAVTYHYWINIFEYEGNCHVSFEVGIAGTEEITTSGIATVKEEDDRIILHLKATQPYKHRGVSHVGKGGILLTLIRKDGVLYTKWGGLRPFKLDQGEEGIYFEEVS